jgi:hypothetical protein
MRLICYPLFRAARFPILLSCLAGALKSFFPGPLGFLFVVVTGLTLVGWWLVGIMKLGANLFQRRWRAGVGRVLLLAASIPLVGIGFRSGDYVHLVALYPYYLYRIEQTPKRPVAFEWGDAAVTVVDGLHLRTLLYDDSGETRAQVGVGRRHPEEEGLWIETSHFVGNFFLQETFNR